MTERDVETTTSPDADAEPSDAEISLPPEDELPPDPEAYDSPRATQARARGLAAPYIAGGEDPDPAAGLSEERRYLRLLILMVVVVVAAGFVLGAIASLLGLTGLLGTP